jgi:hypothetical protein
MSDYNRQRSSNDSVFSAQTTASTGITDPEVYHRALAEPYDTKAYRQNFFDDQLVWDNTVNTSVAFRPATACDLCYMTRRRVTHLAVLNTNAPSATLMEENVQRKNRHVLIASELINRVPSIDGIGGMRLGMRLGAIPIFPLEQIHTPGESLTI